LTKLKIYVILNNRGVIMKVNELKNILNDMSLENEVVFYFLKDNDLERVELETILDTDGQCEITVKHLYTDEGGN
tara:strand:+ start:454 stop:678 length:225 start_codon:yes stop_codon:yes gene_type:complete